MGHEDSLRRSLRRHTTASGILALLLVATIGGWAAASTLRSAVVAGGTFVVDSYVKKVQHATGGIVGDLLVHEGQEVKAGDVLLRLDDTVARTNLGIVTKRQDELMARRTRLVAERDDLPQLSFPQGLIDRGAEPDVQEALTSETRLFKSRRELRFGRKDQLRQRVLQLGHEIEGYHEQRDAFDRAIKVLNDEISTLASLYDRKLVSMQRLSALEREKASYEGDRGEVVAAAAQAAGRIAEARLQMLQIDQDLKAEVGSELRDVQMQLGELQEREMAARDELARIDIRAPQNGYVHELTVHTVGGVVSPAEPIMMIVPEQDRLALDVKINPTDIDQLFPGQQALLRLSAFNQRTTPELKGTVRRIAADLTEDEQTGFSYYLVRIDVPPEETDRLASLDLVPGMPAEAFIQTGERTALSYFLKPLTDQMNRAFREE